MAELALSSARKNLAQLLGPELRLVSGVEGEISSLRNELQFMDAFLRDYDGKHKSEFMEAVAKQIIDVIQEAKDVIDTFTVNTDRHRRRSKYGKCLHMTEPMFMARKASAQIKKIKDVIARMQRVRHDIQERYFESTEAVSEPLLLRRRRDVVAEEEEVVVGLVNDSNVMIEKLIKGDPDLGVISIIGMAGLGKTTLAKKIFNNDEVKAKFSCRAWVCVSNEYRVKELLLSLLWCLDYSSIIVYEDLDLNLLAEKVRECLKNKQYLIVLDDIWEIEVWEEIRCVLPDDKNGSRILITSRIQRAASYTGSIFTHELPSLNEEDGWQLFCRKVFWREECPSDLEDSGRKMVKSCMGLPLAILVLAGYISTKGHREWVHIVDKVNLILTNENILMDVLKLSYDKLPQELKRCFLYLGIFPKDHVIPTKDLIRLWIAERFIELKEIGNPSYALQLENVAECYLEELVDQTLVQVASRRSDGGIKTCRIHNLFRELCLLESKTKGFMEVRKELGIDNCNSKRLSLHCKTQVLPNKYSQLSLHSLFVFGDKIKSDSKSKSWKSLKSAHVLVLKQVSFSSASGLETLENLRYLEIKASNTVIGNNILAYICNLENLETLSLWCVEGDLIVPSGIWKLQQLKHVYFEGSAWLEPPEQMSRGVAMTSLESLGEVYFSPPLVSMMNNGFFHNLTKLSLVFERSLIRQLPGIRHLNNLRKLKIFGIYFNILSDTDVFPSNLTKITLKFMYEFHPGYIKAMGRLPNLQILKLFDGFILGTVDCVSGEFPNLEVLHMEKIDVQGQWRQETDAMPCLARSILNDCYYFNEQDKTFQLFDKIQREDVGKLKAEVAAKRVMERRLERRATFLLQY